MSKPEPGDRASLEEALKTAMARSSYYSRRAGFFQGALEVIAMGVIDDCPTAASRVLQGAGEDYFDHVESQRCKT